MTLSFASENTRENRTDSNRRRNGTTDLAADDPVSDVPALWQFVPLEERHSPPEPASETIRSTLQNIWSQVFHHAEQNNDETPGNKTLESVPQGLLEWVAPMPTWEGDCRSALDDALAHWLARENEDAGIQAVIAAPHSGTVDMVLDWAHQHEFAIIKPPTPQQILENDTDWMDQWIHNKASRLVFPWLERAYLRHHNGLGLVRRLLDWLWESDVPCILVCDSWAWAYLTEVHPLDGFVTSPWTLNALSALQLDRWFSQLARREQRADFVFRQNDNGKLILHHRIGEQTANGSEKTSNYLRHLAARSKGIPGVAWSIWRYSLQINDPKEITKQVQEKAKMDQGITIWVTPWEEIELPHIANRLDGDETFLLHALMLHNGLPDELLPGLLPMTSKRVFGALHRLRTYSVVEAAQNGWQVTPVALPAVRAYLRTEGYLTDELH